MTNTSLDISGKLDAEILEIIERLISVCAESGIAPLLVGAVARDIHFLHVHGMPTGRATADVDFAVLVDSWDAFHTLMGGLIRDGTYTQDEKMGHRLHAPTGFMFDVIPSGERSSTSRDSGCLDPGDGYAQDNCLGGRVSRALKRRHRFQVHS